MIHNDVLRSVRFMLDLSDEALAGLVRLGGGRATEADVAAWLKREEEPGARPCSDEVMQAFLDGLITHRRGPAPTEGRRASPPTLTNNAVLKALRVAFSLKEDDLLAMLRESGFEVSRPEVSALFRAPTHRNYRPCGDQFLRNVLKALTAKVRPAVKDAAREPAPGRPPGRR